MSSLSQLGAVAMTKPASVLPARAAAGERPPPQVVPAQRTQLSGEQAADALASAWQQVKGRPPSERTLSLLAAQWAHETGRGASMFNYNFGGIKGRGPSGLSVQQRTTEGWGASRRRIVDRFRAYETAEQGAADYVRLLARRYPDAVGALEEGDATAFVRGLKSRGYFTGNEGAYARSVAALSELAEHKGFAALGAGGPAAPLSRLSSPPIHQPQQLGGGGLQDATDSPPPFVDAFAIADELGRTAMRILVSDAGRDPEDRRG